MYSRAKTCREIYAGLEALRRLAVLHDSRYIIPLAEKAVKRVLKQTPIVVL